MRIEGCRVLTRDATRVEMPYFQTDPLPAFSLSDHEHCMNSSAPYAAEGRIGSFVSRLNASCLAAIMRAVCARGRGSHERAAERHKLRWPGTQWSPPGTGGLT